MGEGVDSSTLLVVCFLAISYTFNAQDQVVQSKDALTRNKCQLKNQNYRITKQIAANSFIL